MVGVVEVWVVVENESLSKAAGGDGVLAGCTLSCSEASYVNNHSRNLFTTRLLTDLMNKWVDNGYT